MNFLLEIETEDNLDSSDTLENESSNSDEMCTIPNIYSEKQDQEDIAPEESKSPQSFFNDEFCEEQAFPCSIFIYVYHIIISLFSCL